MKLPEPYRQVIDLDLRCSGRVVSIDDLRTRRTARRMAAVFLMGPRGSSGPSGGTPMAVAA